MVKIDQLEMGKVCMTNKTKKIKGKKNKANKRAYEKSKDMSN